MTLPVVLTPEAEADVDDAAQWYDDRRRSLGARLTAAIRATLQRISDKPDLYAEVDDGIRRAPVRRFPYGVFYHHKADRVEVIAILHDRRDPSIWQCRA